MAGSIRCWRSRRWCSTSPSYRSVVVNDLILDEEGQKMSKSKDNVVDPWTTVSEYGADATRFYLLSSSNPWLPKKWDGEALKETNRKLFDTLRSTYRFFAMYAELEGWNHEAPGTSPVEDRASIDRWLLSRLDDLVSSVRADFEAYDLTRAARRIASYVLDDLSNWYVRQTRDRFWATGGGEPGDDGKQSTADAFSTLHSASGHERACTGPDLAVPLRLASPAADGTIRAPCGLSEARRCP